MAAETLFAVAQGEHSRQQRQQVGVRGERSIGDTFGVRLQRGVRKAIMPALGHEIRSKHIILDR
jgi:hypothetical protein